MVTLRTVKSGRFTFTLVNQEDKWHRIVTSGRKSEGDIIQTVEYHGGLGRAWTLVTLVKGSRAGEWHRTGSSNLSAAQVQSIAQQWRVPFS